MVQGQVVVGWVGRGGVRRVKWARPQWQVPVWRIGGSGFGEGRDILGWIVECGEGFEFGLGFACLGLKYGAYLFYLACAKSL